jgi:hypothetical protein
LHLNLTWRLLAAAAVGAFADLYVMGDAYSYAARMRGSYPYHAVALWCVLAGLLLVPLILNFGARRTLLITAALWTGLAIVHTIVLVAETSADPTSHNLWPFEYLMLSLFALPALLGATAGRFAGQAWRAGDGSKV